MLLCNLQAQRYEIILIGKSFRVYSMFFRTRFR